jgi:hypothetical protein
MSGYFKQLNRSDGETRRLLREKLAREEMGDEAYERMVSHADDRSFKIFGVVFIVVFAAAVLVIAWLGW